MSHRQGNTKEFDKRWPIERVAPKPRGSGKRTRRALIRLRHALAADKFIRWGLRCNALPPAGVPFYRCLEWHQWHTRGCP